MSRWPILLTAVGTSAFVFAYPIAEVAAAFVAGRPAEIFQYPEQILPATMMNLIGGALAFGLALLALWRLRKPRPRLSPFLAGALAALITSAAVALLLNLAFTMDMYSDGPSSTAGIVFVFVPVYCWITTLVALPLGMIVTVTVNALRARQQPVQRSESQRSSD